VASHCSSQPRSYRATMPRQTTYLPAKDYELPDIDVLSLIFGNVPFLKCDFLLHKQSPKKP